MESNVCCAGFAGAAGDPIAALLLCTPSLGFVDLSVINGDIVVKDGVLQTLDLKVFVWPPISPRQSLVVMPERPQEDHCLHQVWPTAVAAFVSASSLQELITEHTARSAALCKHLPPWYRSGNQPEK